MGSPSFQTSPGRRTAILWLRNGQSPITSRVLKRLRPRKLPWRHRADRSAVAAVFRHTDKGCELLFIERAQRQGDPWSGQIAFPGGRRQADDLSTCAVAIRETREELGLDLVRNGLLHSRMADVLTRRHNQLLPMVVTPYLFELTQPFEAIINQEVAQIFWVPVSHLLDPTKRAYLTWQVGPLRLRMRYIDYQGHRIWGLTLLMLYDILNHPALQKE